MTEANVIFILDGAKLAIQCTPIDKMKDICQKYSSKIKKDMNSLLFSYKGNQLNLESNFKDQVNLKDKNTDEMIILVNKRDDNVYSNRKNLIENIKSIYFIKILFSHMNEKNKLKLLKYNKNLQETMDFKLINYKFYSGRYIIYDTNGKGREYSGEDDKLIFEGEYLNGKKNGKGKEYYSNGELFYEGEYLNGKINGKGKEYNYEGKLIFEGENLNGKRKNGKIYYDNKNKEIINENRKKKEYYNNGKLKFDGDYLNGE
jgi:antitoxin component YwqK of YwqJK toxin-antitoxin module